MAPLHDVRGAEPKWKEGKDIQQPTTAVNAFKPAHLPQITVAVQPKKKPKNEQMRVNAPHGMAKKTTNATSAHA